MSESSATATEYRCPGETYSISRAVHLGRLVRFHPACLHCPHRQDQQSLSARQRRQLAEVQRHAEPPRLFGPEGVTAVYWNQLTLAVAGRAARALGLWLRGQRGDGSPPTALVASDGRPLTPELVSALVEGLRWAGCHTVEIPAATTACTAWAVSHLACDGGLLVGNPGAGPQTVGLKFFGPEGRPLSSPGELDAIQRIFENEPDRPTRRFGSRRRFQADVPYLARLAEDFHGLRPLRFVLQSDCQPFERQLRRLLADTACRCLDFQREAAPLPEQVRQQAAHFGLQVRDDGERCVLYDEQGQAVPPARLAALVGQELSAVGWLGQSEAVPQGSRPPLPCRAATYETLRREEAPFAAFADGRFWYRLEPGCWAADALQTLTLLLRHLSRSDRPLSAALDALAAAG